MKSATKEFGRLLRGALPFSVVNPNPQNLLENVLSYNSTDDAGAGVTLIKADGDIAVGRDLKLDNGGMEIGPGGNVGVGVYPSTKLHVKSNGTGLADYGSLYLEIDTPTNFPAMVIQTSTGGNAADTHGLYIKNTAAGAGFRVDDDFYITSSGRVGIGLTPSYTLDVQAVGSSFNPARFSGHSSSIDTFIYTDTNYWAFGDAASYGGNLWGGHKGNNELYAYTNGANRLTINSSGDLAVDTDTLFVDASADRVGIGTSSADGTLHVHTASAGSVTAHGSADDLVVESSADAGLSILTPAANNGRIYFGSPTNNAYGQIDYDHATNDMVFATAGSGKLTIDSSGNVGINQNNPQYKLDVDGTVNVEGQFRTAMTIASPMLVEVTAGTYWSLGWWQAADNSWWLLGKMSEETSGFTRADAEFYVPLGMIADVPSA